MFRIVDDKIELIYQNDFNSGIKNLDRGSTFFANTDGSVSVLENKVNIKDDKQKDSLYSYQFLTVTQDKKISRFPVKYHNSSDRIPVFQKNGLFIESQNKIWFFFDIYKYLNEEYIPLGCCGGLSLFENNEWTLFNENNNLESPGFFNSYFPISSVMKISEGKYFVTGFGFYEMGNDLMLKKLDTKKVFDNSLLSNQAQPGRNHRLKKSFLFLLWM